ncbi:MAG TPA: YigZ family protein [Gillisia sp.]|nr:YigZ family protein [Gillisia sp.]
MLKDTYRTLIEPSPEVLFKEKNSKFFGYGFPVTTEEDVKEHLEELKKKHHQARHWCYAWQIGKEEEQRQFRANDDGEPSNSAGMPIYGQLLSFDLTNVLVVVVRYFGGTKLGVGGLIQAYKTTAQLALESGKIAERTIDKTFEIKFDYPEMNIVMRLIKEHNLTIIKQNMGLDCKVYLSVRSSLAEDIFEKFSAIFKVDIAEMED